VRVLRLDLMASRAEAEAGVGALDVELDVAKGYYVRALARDLAARLGTVGHLAALRRTRSGPFSLAEASPYGASADSLLERICPLAKAAAKALPVVRLTDAGVTDARCGRIVRAPDIEGSALGPAAWVDAQGALVAIGEADPEGHGRVVRGFAPPATT
jgi:tRNA pseudouridine55 synthase